MEKERKKFLEEKSIVNDVLSSIKFNLKEFEEAITETANMELRQALQNLRNSSESFQYELFKLAESKGYYMAPQKATEDEISSVKKEVSL